MSSFVTVCEEAARLGAAALLERLGRVEARHKGPADLVTEADFASQEVIRRTVLEAFPDHDFLGEETLPDDTADPARSDGRGEYRWIADPLDGTTNFVHGVPHFCVSLALEHRDELLVGCVYNPISGESFLAVRGEGARLNSERITTSDVADLSGALAATGFPTVVGPDSSDVKIFMAGLGRCQAMRRTGSAALNMSYLAAGRFDVAWSFCTKVWDVAAGGLLIAEAGGIVTSPDGGPFRASEGIFLAAANQRLFDQLFAMTEKATQ